MQHRDGAARDVAMTVAETAAVFKTAGMLAKKPLRRQFLPKILDFKRISGDLT
jgi:hypothetical protein